MSVEQQHQCISVCVKLHPVEVCEGGSEVFELLLADSFSVTRQDLCLHLTDGASDGGEQWLPSHTDVLRHTGQSPVTYIIYLLNKSVLVTRYMYLLL